MFNMHASQNDKQWPTPIALIKRTPPTVPDICIILYSLNRMKINTK